MKKLKIDVFKNLKLPKDMLCGLINKVESPKGLRKLNDADRYEYHLNDKLIQIYNGDPAELEDGIYWVMDIYKYRGAQYWNHYLVVVDTESDSVYPVAEFLQCHDSTWIVDAIPYIKAYFNMEFDKLQPIEITRFDPPKRQKQSWGYSKK